MYWYCTKHESSGTEGTYCDMCVQDFRENFIHQEWVKIK